MKKSVDFYINLLSSQKIVFWLLPPLMVWLFVGTVAQKYIGLYEAQKLFFENPIVWLGYIPLPGTTSILAVITISLCIKFIYKSRWTWKRSGVNLSHFGVLLLLIGGLIAMTTKQEGALIIFEGEKDNHVIDYYERELVIKKNDAVVNRTSFYDLKKNPRITLDSRVRIDIKETCKNCSITRRIITNDNQNKYQSMAQAVELEHKKPELLAEQNLSGITFELSGLSEKKDGIYILFDIMPKPINIKNEKDDYSFSFHKSKRLIPFTVELVSFETIFYPGTNKAKDYQSDIIIHDHDISWPARIEMNSPFRYKGYTLYQSSFAEDENGDTATILAVVKNSSWLLPYIGTIILSIGLLIHASIALYSLKRIRTIIVLLLLLFPSITYADNADISYKKFSNLPILHEGRIKPLDSYARVILRDLTGSEYYHEKTAIAWLAEAIFNPNEALNEPIFEVRSKVIKQKLSLDTTTGKTYTVKQLLVSFSKKRKLIESVIEKDEDTLTADQIELRNLYNKVSSYLELLSSVTLVLPIQDDPSQVSYRLAYKNKEIIQKKIKNLIHKKGDNLNTYNQEEIILLNTGMRMDILNKSSSLSKNFRVIPYKDNWITPWDSLNKKSEMLLMWEKLAIAFSTKNLTLWNSTLHDMYAYFEKNTETNFTKLKTEKIYRSIKSLSISEGLYFIVLMMFVLSSKFKRFEPILKYCLNLAILLHGLSIIARMYILDRPPVGTLYESILFVSFITSLCTAILYHYKKDIIYLISGTMTAFILLLIVPAFSLKGDTMEVLVAVLNTNFWLATHVVIITAAYGVCMLLSAIAHVILYKQANGFRHDKQDKLLHRLTLLALFLTTLGTLLGGVWADQSWGRFWGWDPKENGALLIVLWLSWVLHGRMSGDITKLRFTACSAALSIIVALSWFGVNLLSVGLHSYGFIDGIASGLISFILIELCFIFFFLSKNKKII